MPNEMEKIKKQRMINMQKHETDNTADRLAVKEQVKNAQLNKLIRSI
jgi:DNA-binding TFAR19-related protein (PDSD5 family)